MSLAAESPCLPSEAADWIVAIANDRDRACFIALFTQFAPKVKSYLLRHGMFEQTAEELAQETLLAVWRKAEQFDPSRATAGAWIYTIARNLRTDSFRRERPFTDGRIDGQALDQLTPEQELKLSQSANGVRAAIDDLPPDQAQVMRLSFFQDLTHPEIADELGVPLGTVKSRIRLATARLRASLESEVHPEDRLS